MSTMTAINTQTKTNPNVVRNAYRKPKKWTFEKCLVEAQKHDSISAWADASDSSYRSAKRYEWMDACTAHITKYPNWSREKCLDTVSAFSSVADWRSKNPESYRFARDTSEAFLKQCKRVIAKNSKRSINRRWTKDAVIAEARKYATVTQWHASGGGSYRKAKQMKKDGWWDEATSHMTKHGRSKKPYI